MTALRDRLQAEIDTLRGDDEAVDTITAAMMAVLGIAVRIVDEHEKAELARSAEGRGPHAAAAYRHLASVVRGSGFANEDGYIRWFNTMTNKAESKE